MTITGALEHREGGQRHPEIQLYPMSHEDRVAYLEQLFGGENIGDVIYEVNSGVVDTDDLAGYASDLDSYYYSVYMPDKFGIPKKDRTLYAARAAHRRYEDVAIDIAQITSNAIIRRSDMFDIAHDIALPPDSPSIRAIDYLRGKMTERTAFEYFRHLKWLELAGTFVSEREKMGGRTCFDNLRQNFLSHLCDARMGETESVPLWSVHNNDSNGVEAVRYSPPTSIPPNTHIKFLPIDMYTLSIREGGGIRFNMSPRLKDPRRAVLKYEEAVVSGFEDPLGKLMTDALGSAIYVDGDRSERNEFVEVFLHWFESQYPNSEITEKRVTDGTEGKAARLNWRRFKLKISPLDDPSILGRKMASAEFIISTITDYFTNEYELDAPGKKTDDSVDASVERNNGRAHDLHELRRLWVLQPYHFPPDIIFPNIDADNFAGFLVGQREEALEQVRHKLLAENHFQPHHILIFE